MKRHLLLTGSLGLVGSELLRRLLTWNVDVQITLLIRPKGDLSALQRAQELFEECQLSLFQLQRVHVISGDLSDFQFGLEEETYGSLIREITEIFHAAAEVSLNQSLGDARRANCVSTQHLIQFAQKIKGFVHFHHISTFAVAYDSKTDHYFENIRTEYPQTFRNSYEQSKFEAELLFVQSQIPFSIYRPSLIAGDSKTGWTLKFDTFYPFIRSFLETTDKSIPIRIPVPAGGRLDVVTIDSVSDILFHFWESAPNRESGKVFHLVAGNEAMPLIEAFQEGFRFLELPNLSLVEIENLTPQNVGDILKTSGVLNEEIVKFLYTSLPYAFEKGVYDTSELDSALRETHLRIKSIRPCLSKLIQYGINSNWGVQKQIRPPLVFPLPPDQEPIALVGMGGLFPKAKNLKEFWNHLQTDSHCFTSPPSSRCGKVPYPWVGILEDLEFPSLFFRIPPLAANSMDRIQKIVLMATQEAFESLGYPNLSIPTDTALRTGMVLGYSGLRVESDYLCSQRIAWNYLKEILKKNFDKQVPIHLTERILKKSSPTNEDTLAGSLPNVAVGRVMSVYDLHGPSWVVQGGNSSTHMAIEQAMDCLRNRDADLMIAGGVHALLDPTAWNCLEKEEKLSPRLPRPFSPEADGTTLGEGGAVFILKRLSDAIRDGNSILATLCSVGRAPNLSEAIYQSLKPLKKDSQEIVHLETLGSSIPWEDQYEIGELQSTFFSLPHLGNLTSKIGYLAGASGAASLAKLLLCLKHQTWPPEVDLPKGREIPQSDNPLCGVISHEKGHPAYCLLLQKSSEANPISTPKNKDPIAVLSSGAILPGVNGINSYWNLILSGEHQIRELSDSDFYQHPSAFFSRDSKEDRSYGRLGARVNETQLSEVSLQIPPVVLKKADPSHRFFLRSALEALNQVHFRSSAARTAIIVGESKSSSQALWNLLLQSSWLEWKTLIRTGLNLSAEEMDRIEAIFLSQTNGLIDEDSLSSTLLSQTVAHLARVFQFQGGHCIIDAACGSSLAALSVAVRELRMGKVDQVLFSGIGVSVTPAYNIPFAQCQALSATGSRPLDPTADGIVLGEGSVTWILKRLKDVQTEGIPYLGIILGIGGSSDGKGSSMMAPQVRGQSLALERAFEDAAIHPDTVQAVEAHATGTSIGDQVELQSIAESYQTLKRLTPLWISSVKAQIGHTIGAAGAAGALKMLLGMKNERLPPTLVVSPSPQGETLGLRISSQSEYWQKAQFPRRCGVSAFGFGGTNWHVILEEGSQEKRVSISERKKTVFLFPGHGSPYWNMGFHFYQKIPTFRASLRRSADFFQNHLEKSIEEWIYSSFGAQEAETRDALFQSDLVQPIIFVMNLAYYEMLREWGIQPDLFYGHSVGEISAACAAGIISFEDGLKASYFRGKIYADLQKKGIDTGKMVALSASQAEVLLWLRELPSLQIATLNSTQQTVVSGPTSPLLAWIDLLKKKGISTKLLPVSVAWHSQLAKTLGEKEAAEIFSSLKFKLPQKPLMSNLELCIYQRPDISDSWAKQIGNSIDFISAIEKLYHQGARQFIEVGPRRILTGFVSEVLADREYQILSSDLPTPQTGKEIETYRGWLYGISNH